MPQIGVLIRIMRFTGYVLRGFVVYICGYVRPVVAVRAAVSTLLVLMVLTVRRRCFGSTRASLLFMFSPAGLVVKVISMVQGILASRGGTLLLTGLRGRQRAGILP